MKNLPKLTLPQTVLDSMSTSDFVEVFDESGKRLGVATLKMEDQQAIDMMEDAIARRDAGEFDDPNRKLVNAGPYIDAVKRMLAKSDLTGEPLDRTEIDAKIADKSSEFYQEYVPKSERKTDDNADAA